MNTPINLHTTMSHPIDLYTSKPRLRDRWYRSQRASSGGNLRGKSVITHFYYKSSTPPPKGLDIGLRLDLSDYRHSLGLSQISDPITLALGNSAGDVGGKRPSIMLAIIIGF